MTTVLAQHTPLNTSREYNLRTSLKPTNDNKSRFDNLWLSSYHIGPYQSDAVFTSDRTSETVVVGFLSPVFNDPTMEDPNAGWSWSQAFNSGNEAAWQLGKFKIL